MKTYKETINTAFIGFKRYSQIEFDGFIILFDFDWATKFKNYIQEWGLDEDAVFEDLVNDCIILVEGKLNKRNDLPMRFTASSRFGTTTNLLNGIGIQFIEDTLFGKEYKSEIHTIHAQDEQMVHFFY